MQSTKTNISAATLLPRTSGAWTLASAPSGPQPSVRAAPSMDGVTRALDQPQQSHGRAAETHCAGKYQCGDGPREQQPLAKPEDFLHPPVQPIVERGERQQDAEGQHRTWNAIAQIGEVACKLQRAFGADPLAIGEAQRAQQCGHGC